MSERTVMRVAALAASLVLLATGAARSARAADVEVHEAGVGFRATAAVPNLPLRQDEREGNLYFGKGAHWLPFEALLEGRGEAVEGTLVLREEPLLDRAPMEYRRHVSLAARGKKRISFPVLSKYEASYALSLETDGGGSATLGRAREIAIKGPREVGRESALVLFVTARTGAPTHLLHRLRGEEHADDRVIVPVRASSLPLDAVAYDAVDVVVLDDVPLGEITERAASALAQHVARGGVLVVSLRENAAGAAGSPLDPLLPGVPDGLESLGEVHALSAATGEPCRFEPPQPATALALREGAVAWASPSRAIAHRRHERGTVVALGFSLAAPYMVRWTGAPLLMDGLCDARREPLLELPGHARPVIVMKAIGEALRDSMVKPMPPFEVVAWSLASYALVVLVLPYMVFKRLDRLEWAWAAILGLALAGAAAVYVIGGRYLGGESYVHRVSIVECADAGGPALRHSRWALFSAEGGRVDIAFDSSTAVPSPVPDERDPGARVEALRVSCDAARACAIATHTQDSTLFETTEEETLPGRVRLGPWLRVERDRDLSVGRAWILDREAAAEVRLSAEATTLQRPSAPRSSVVDALRKEPDRLFGHVAAAVLEEAGDASRRHRRPVLVFQYEGAPGLRSSDIRERGLSFAFVEAEAPATSVTTSPWSARWISGGEAGPRVAADSGNEFQLRAEVPPGFDLRRPFLHSTPRAALEARHLSGPPSILDPQSREWISMYEVVDPAIVRRTPLGQAYLRARVPAAREYTYYGRGRPEPPTWRYNLEAELTRRVP